MEEIDIIRRDLVVVKEELVVISADKMDFQQEAFDSIAKTEKATSLTQVELRQSIDILSELHNEIKRTDGTITSVKNMVAELQKPILGSKTFKKIGAR